MTYMERGFLLNDRNEERIEKLMEEWDEMHNHADWPPEWERKEEEILKQITYYMDVRDRYDRIYN